MSKPSCHSHLSSAATTPDLEMPNPIENHVEVRRPSLNNERRTTNVNYVRHVLRKIFGGYNKKYFSNAAFDDVSGEATLEHLQSPVFINPCLQFEKRTKFSGEILLDWFLIHFESRTDHLPLIRQVIAQCCTCLISLGVLRMESEQTNEFFQSKNLYSWSTTIDDEEINVALSPAATKSDVQAIADENPEQFFQPTSATAILDILKNEYGIHSDTIPIETKSTSTQINFEPKVEQQTQTDPAENLFPTQTQSKTNFLLSSQSCCQSEIKSMSSYTTSKTDSDYESSPPSAVRHQEVTFRRANQLILTGDKSKISTSIDLTDDERSESLSSISISLDAHSSSIFQHNHAKFTSELLLEWLRLNGDTTTTAPKQESRSAIEPSFYTKVNEDVHDRTLETDFRSCVSTTDTDSSSGRDDHRNKSSIEFSFGSSDDEILSDTQAILSDLIFQIDEQSKPVELPFSQTFIPPPPPPPLLPRFPSDQTTRLLPLPITNNSPGSIPCAPPLPNFLERPSASSSSEMQSSITLSNSSIPMAPPLPPAPNFQASTPVPVPPPMAPPLPVFAVPPPPPPFPNFNGPSVPPPPPPPPFLNCNGVPPPPPLPGFAGPATPAGLAGPPPPPPMMPGFGAPPQLPTYLRKKQKYAVTEPVKKVQWSKINPYTIKKDSLWVTVEEEKYVNDELFADLKKNFANKIAPSRQPIHELVDKSKELRVLDAKAAQNFAIMFSQLKAPPSTFRDWMLSCDNEYLKDDFLKQLEKYLPTAEELKSLADLKNEINDLQYSEQYFCAIGDIKRLKQRLKTLLFKANYKETVEETDKAFLEVRTACDHVRHSNRFRKLLELILTVGNYMNSSAKSYEPVHGFDISFLPKLHSTKANDGRRSLLHFIIQAIEDKHRDLLAFSDEFFSISDGVSKINILELQKQPQEIQRALRCAREELTIAKSIEDPIENDRFVASIEDFLIRADDDVARLERLDREMTQSYLNLCDFLTVDSKNYSLTDFFTDLKTFCTLFSTCVQEVRAWREQAARAVKNSNSHSSIERKTLDTPDETVVQRRTLSRIEDLIDKRKSNRGLTPTVTPTKKRSQS